MQSYLQNYTSDLHLFFVHVTYGRGSVLLWRRSDKLRISGFVDDVVFAYQLWLLVQRRKASVMAVHSFQLA